MPGYPGAMRIAHHSDLVALVPAFLISAMWHPRLDADPAHRWLRETVVTVCQQAYSGR